jgi:hypothetical protein
LLHGGGGFLTTCLGGGVTGFVIKVGWVIAPLGAVSEYAGATIVNAKARKAAFRVMSHVSNLSCQKILIRDP